MKVHKFKSVIEIIGINPYVQVPQQILKQIFKDAAKDKGPIPVCGSVNEKSFQQTLVRYQGDWRLYINTFMLTNSPQRIGEKITITLAFDPSDRTIKPHPKLVKALKENLSAKKVFDQLIPSRQKEIVRYIGNLKSEISIEKNITKVINHLMGKEKFAGRDKPIPTR